MCPSVCNFGRSGERTKEEGGEEAIAGRDRTAKCAEGPKLRRGTAWPRNKCGLRRITAMRDADRALADKTVPAKNGE